MNTPGTPIVSTYDFGKTVQKAAYPFSVVIIVEGAYLILHQCGIQVDKSILYALAVSGYATIAAIVNYFKNRKK